MVKIYLEHLNRLSEVTGDIRKLSEILVSLSITCRKLNNSLEQGMAAILRWVFTLPRRVITNQQLIVAFMSELHRRMGLQEVDPNTVCELGIFITTELIKKKGWNQSTTEDD